MHPCPSISPRLSALPPAVLVLYLLLPAQSLYLHGPQALLTMGHLIFIIKPVLHCPTPIFSSSANPPSCPET